MQIQSIPSQSDLNQHTPQNEQLRHAGVISNIKSQFQHLDELGSEQTFRGGYTDASMDDRINLMTRGGHSKNTNTGQFGYQNQNIPTENGSIMQSHKNSLSGGKGQAFFMQQNQFGRKKGDDESIPSSEGEDDELQQRDQINAKTECKPRNAAQPRPLQSFSQVRKRSQSRHSDFKDYFETLVKQVNNQRKVNKLQISKSAQRLYNHTTFSNNQKKVTKKDSDDKKENKQQINTGKNSAIKMPKQDSDVPNSGGLRDSLKHSYKHSQESVTAHNIDIPQVIMHEVKQQSKSTGKIMSKRELKSFMTRQENFKNEKQLRINVLQERKSQAEVENCTFKPKTTRWVQYEKSVKRQQKNKKQKEQDIQEDAKLKSGEIALSVDFQDPQALQSLQNKNHKEASLMQIFDHDIVRHRLTSQGSDGDIIALTQQDLPSGSTFEIEQVLQNRNEEYNQRQTETVQLRESPLKPEKINNESFSKMLEGDSKDMNTQEGSPDQNIEENKIQQVGETVSKKKETVGAVGPPKLRSHEKFLQDQQIYELRKKKKVDKEIQINEQKQKEQLTFKPQISKVSRVLGEISIQQHIIQNKEKLNNEDLEDADLSTLARQYKIHDKLYEQAMQKKVQKIQIEAARDAELSQLCNQPKTRTCKINLARSTNKVQMTIDTTPNQDSKMGLRGKSKTPDCRSWRPGGNASTSRRGAKTPLNRKLESEYESSQSRVPKLNPKSKQYFIQKFTKEIIRVWQMCPSLADNEEVFLDEKSRQNETMNFRLMRFVLSELGFVQEFGGLCQNEEVGTRVSMFNVNLINQIEKQDQKIVHLWRILGGEYYGHITLNNLRMLLLAIKGLHVQPNVRLPETVDGKQNIIRLSQVLNNEDMPPSPRSASASPQPFNIPPQSHYLHTEERHVSPQVPRAIVNNQIRVENIQHQTPGSQVNDKFEYLGVFTIDGDMYIFDDDVQKCMKFFKMLSQNRMSFEQEQHVLRKKERENIQMHPFRPFVSHRNTILAERSKSRLSARPDVQNPQSSQNFAKSQMNISQASTSPNLVRLQQPTRSQIWVQQQRELQIEKERSQCTFRPTITKSPKFGQNIKQGFKTTRTRNPRESASAMLQKANTNFNNRLEGTGTKSQLSLNLSKIIRNQNPSKYKSKDLMEQTGDKFNDLYVLSKKIDFIKPKKDKTAIEIDFEKNRGDCTFTPNLLKSSLKTSKSSNRLNFEITQQMPKFNQGSSLANLDTMNGNLTKSMASLRQSSNFNGNKSQKGFLSKNANSRPKSSQKLDEINGATERVMLQKQVYREKEIIKKLQDRGLFLNQKNINMILKEEKQANRPKSRVKSRRQPNVNNLDTENVSRMESNTQPAIPAAVNMHIDSQYRESDSAAVLIPIQTTGFQVMNTDHHSSIQSEKAAEQQILSIQSSHKQSIIDSKNENSNHQENHLESEENKHNPLDTFNQSAKGQESSVNISPNLGAEYLQATTDPREELKQGSTSYTQLSGESSPHRSAQNLVIPFANAQEQENQEETNFEQPSPQPEELQRSSNQQANAGLTPLLFIDINITPTRQERIQVYDGDTPEDLAAEFCQLHNLNSKMQEKMTKMLSQQMSDINKN